MGDYGHDLLLGTFITPQNRRPEDVVALAQLTEQAGLDIATFQDHPYQPAFLDTWTLMSWVAAKTTTLRISANVLNLPLRPPAVMARAVASLDLLSGGRVELGLGAGAFWDAIEAMGAPRPTPGQAVDALEEGIDIIRGIWDVSQRGGLRVDGEHHRVAGAKRGPEPAHPIEIWLGAYKPRMLRLTGAKADGWLPSMQYMPLDDAPAANRRIDRAARDAGRDPREIRRLINLSGGAFLPDTRGFLQAPPEVWVEQLLPLVTEHGFSGLILPGDDPETVAGFGTEVAPALREAVAAAREAAGTVTGPVRPARAVAMRREGIDYDGLPGPLAGIATEPGDHGYAKVRSTYIRPGSPGLVLRPTDVEQVRDALAYAREQDVPLSVRSGGHGISGRSTNDGGIVLDVGRLDQIEVLDAAAGRVRLGPGARWGQVARELAPHGLGMSSGDFGDVGVGGLVTAGGIGFMSRKHGLTIDHVTAAEMVLADGTFVRADAQENADLFWAVRGAGGNFGILTAVELDAYPVGDVVFSTMVFDAADTAAVLERWGRTVEEAPRELTSFLSVVAQRGAVYAQAYSVYAGDDTQAAVGALTPLLQVGPLLDQGAQLVPYHRVVRPQDAEHDPAGTSAFRGGLLEHITPDAATVIQEGLRSRAAGWLQIRAVGGAVNDVDPMATAYAHRTQNFAVNAVAARSRTERLDAMWDELRPHMDGLYISFEGDRRPERLLDAFPEPTLTRLRELKRRYDPDNVFDRNFPIPPADG